MHAYQPRQPKPTVGRRLRQWIHSLRTGRGRGPTLKERATAQLERLRRAMRIVLRTLWRALPFVGGAAMMALLPTAVIYGYRYVRTSPHFRVSQVEVTGHSNVKVEDVLEIAGLQDGPSLLDVDLDAIRASLEQHPWIRSAKVDRELPDRVTIALSEREPAALLALGSLYLVDKRGVPFKRVEPGEQFVLPVLTGLSLDDLSPDSPSERRGLAEKLIKDALAVLDHWRRGPLGRRIDADEVNMDPLFGHSIVLGQGSAIATGATVHLGFGNIQEKLSRLETILADAARRGRHVLEVRLDNTADPNRVAVRFRPEAPAAEGSPDDTAERNTDSEETNRQGTARPRAAAAREGDVWRIGMM